jgi:hypothetical protein
MKARGCLLALALMILTAAWTPAQDQENADNQGLPTIYVASVPIRQIYEHPRGYRVIYFRSDIYPDEVFVPINWFSDVGGRASIQYSVHPSVPYMEVYYENGEFDHVRIHAHSYRGHRSWGQLPRGTEYADEFDIETLEMNY